MPTPKLSVIIPAYNEADNFKSNKLAEVDDYLLKQDYTWEVFVVDDGSTDQTAPLVEQWIKDKPNWHLIKNSHAGKSKAVSTGMSKATGLIRLFTDFDQATPISAVEQVIQRIDQGADIVIGSRQVAGASREKEPFIRHLMGRVFNLLVQFLALRGISDSQCGFKAFSNKATQDLFSKLVVYKNKTVADAYTGAFDVELLFLARKTGYSIVQIPVQWKYVDTNRVSALKDSVRMFIDILRIRLAYITGRYSNQS